MSPPDHRTRRLRNGLTVLELLFIFIIVAILMALGYAVTGKLLHSTRVSVTLKTISMLYNACEAHRFIHGDYPGAEPGNRITFDPAAKPLMNANSPHILNAIHVNYKFDVSNLSPDGVYLDPWGNPFVYEYNDPDDNVNAEVEGSDAWWKNRGLSSRVKIYSVGAEDNFDDSRGSGPYWKHFRNPDTDEPLVLFKQIGE